MESPALPFKRMIQKAKELGILTVYKTERKNGSQSSNLYIINRFPSNELPKEDTVSPPKETNNLLKTENQRIKERKEEPSVLDFTYVSDRVPQPFTKLVKCFFPEAKTIEEYWKMVKITAHQYLWENDPELVLDVATQSFKQLIRKLKFNRTIKNPFAYFYGILENKFFILYDEALKVKYNSKNVEMVFSLGLNQSLTVG